MKVKSFVFYSVLASALVAVSPDTKAQSWLKLNCGDNYSPIKSVAPVYPKRAKDRGIEGSIEMLFTILEDGSVDAIEVKETSKKVFIRSATRAVNELQFPPCVQNGLATRVTGVSIKYDFFLK